MCLYAKQNALVTDQDQDHDLEILLSFVFVIESKLA